MSELRNFLESYFFPSAAFSLGELKLGNLVKSDTEEWEKSLWATETLSMKRRSSQRFGLDNYRGFFKCSGMARWTISFTSSGLSDA